MVKLGTRRANFGWRPANSRFLGAPRSIFGGDKNQQLLTPNIIRSYKISSNPGQNYLCLHSAHNTEALGGLFQEINVWIQGHVPQKGTKEDVGRWSPAAGFEETLGQEKEPRLAAI